MWQAQHLQACLQKLYPHCDVQILGMTTRGDQILDKALSKVGGKGLFVKELETALEDGRADLAVHSLKDVPMVMPDGFDLTCVKMPEMPLSLITMPVLKIFQKVPLWGHRVCAVSQCCEPVFPI
jgi:porphobilinogen deaminase